MTDTIYNMKVTEYNLRDIAHVHIPRAYTLCLNTIPYILFASLDIRLLATHIEYKYWNEMIALRNIPLVDCAIHCTAKHV